MNYYNIATKESSASKGISVSLHRIYCVRRCVRESSKHMSYHFHFANSVLR